MPVDEVLPELLNRLEGGSSVVLAAPPGAGKTTRVPFALASAAWCTGRIVVLEPRRIAARAAAGYMAAQLGEKVGETVGYRVRLESQAGAGTRILFVTEGVFARMIMDDPELSGTSALLFDEFHERSLDADLGLALALDAQQALRPDLRIVVMSATLETGPVSALMGNAPLVASAGRSFPVEIRHVERRPEQSIEDATAAVVRRLLLQEDGSIVAFLPGQKEIRRTAEMLARELPANTSLHQLYGAIDARQQDEAIRPPRAGMRKVVLATAIAETSLTIDGVRIVVDSGLKRVPRYEARTGLTRLETVRASQSSIVQRAGRAGRTAPGIAVRLWREQQTAALPVRDTPEILEADLSGFVLDLAAWGVTDPARLRLLDQPPAPAWSEAVDLLKRFHALDGQGLLTTTGKRMRELPLPPRFAHMAVEAGSHGQALDAAMLAVLIAERGLGGNSVDLTHRLERFRSEPGERASASRRLARSIAQGHDNADAGRLSPGALLSLAWPERIARTRGPGKGYLLANGRGALMDEADALSKSEFLVVAELQGAAAAQRILSAAPLSLNEIEVLHGEAIAGSREIFFDAASRRIRARQTRRLGAILLSDMPVEITLGDRPEVLLFRHMRDFGLDVLDWGKAAARLRARLAFLHAHDPRWPDVSDASLLAGLEDWLAPYLPAARAISDIDPGCLHEGLCGLLALSGQSRAEADRLAPEFFVTPAGSHVPIRYDGGSAFLAVRVQELFGLARHPSVLGGVVPMTVELLSPALRPIQVTADLPGFWSGSWREVRTEMRGRYPRHPWPEDPANAAPTTRAKPRGQ